MDNIINVALHFSVAELHIELQVSSVLSQPIDANSQNVPDGVSSPMTSFRSQPRRCRGSIGLFGEILGSSVNLPPVQRCYFCGSS